MTAHDTDVTSARDAPLALGVGAEVGPLGELLVLPTRCACCLAPSATTRREVGPGGRVALVPLCTPCAAHAARGDTRLLAVLLAGALLGVTLAALLPLASLHERRTVFGVIAGLAALAPTVVAWRFARVEPGHGAVHRAVHWTRAGRLACAHEGWALEVAERSGSASRAARYREPRRLFASLVLALASAGLAVLSAAAHFADVRVLDVGDERIDVALDGAAFGTVLPSSVESPEAGRWLRWPGGRHRAVATRPDGSVVFDGEIEIEPGRAHLFAPAAEGTCFWIEVRTYGESRVPTRHEALLPEGGGFWALPREVDGWFSEPPEDALGLPATGGELAEVRQGRCRDRPR